MPSSGQWGGTYDSKPYNFRGAIGVDIRNCSCAENGFLYVTDTYNDRIQVFNPNAGPAVRDGGAVAPDGHGPGAGAGQPDHPGPGHLHGYGHRQRSAVGQVEIAIQDFTTGKWWDAGTQSWVTSKQQNVSAWSGTAGTSVSWRWVFLGVSLQGRYVAEFRTRDAAGNLSQVVARTFAMPNAPGGAPPIPTPEPLDTTAAHGTHTYPTQPPVMTVPGADITFTGTAADNVGVTNLRFGIKRLSDSRWLQSLTSPRASAAPSARRSRTSTPPRWSRAARCHR